MFEDHLSHAHELYVSDILQLIGNKRFFGSLSFYLAHMIMEWWKLGTRLLGLSGLSRRSFNEGGSEASAKNIGMLVLIRKLFIY
jgi:hypothetical protein